MGVNELVRIDIESEIYPEKLRIIKEPPKALYCAGDLSLLNTLSISVVGSRRYTLYGKMTSQMIGERLAKFGITVVSGLAFGIDAFAHEGTLNAGGKAIAVLGTGHNKFYPRKNLPLYNRIIKEGLVISEYEPDTPGGKYTFPRRNRIISALGEALVVVEAGLNSGSLITSQYAMEQGKEIYAVPGNINSQFSVGTNFLIRDGAKPLIVVDDLIEDLGMNPMAEELDFDVLGDDEARVVQAVTTKDGINVNEIAHIVNMKPGRVSAILTILEMKGIVLSYGGKLYLAKTNN